MSGRNIWDIFAKISITPSSGVSCRDCSWAQNDVHAPGTYVVAFVFRGDSDTDTRPYRAYSARVHLFGICEDHVGYWQNLVNIHNQGLLEFSPT